MNSQQNELIKDLRQHCAQIDSLRAAVSLMYWDQGTYLPESGANDRGEHLKNLAQLSHGLETSPRLDQTLRRLQDLPFSDAESDDSCLVRVALREFDRSTRISAQLAGDMSENSSRSYSAWKKAREQNNFAPVVNCLKRNVELSRELASCLRTPEQTGLLDPLIDLYDPGFTETQIRPLFDSLRPRLVGLLNSLTAAGPFNNACLLAHYPEPQQLEFAEHVVRELGYDYKRGRMDKTPHPFMVRLSKGDVRITTRTKANDLSECLFSAIHEAGHALYEQGIDAQLEGTPLAQGASRGVHESQSRLWENQVGRSLEFWHYFYPSLQRLFPSQLGKVSLTDFHRAINRVQAGLIRTDADEVSYNLHVMIRFDLEAALLSGTLSVEDLPDAWNERYRDDLGVVPASLTEGVLQDVHWFHGSIGGSFQGYTIGNILSAQFYQAARTKLKDLDQQIASGNFRDLRDWLRINVHRYGRKFEGPDLIKRSTGASLVVEPYLDYLESKYRSL